MEMRDLRELLSTVASGDVTVDEAMHRLSSPSFEDLGYAKPDLDRSRRQGVSEVVYGAGKTAEQIA
ncbi:MAG: 1-(5-phosphoribosyl)-5-amino-4-imidazole-carboxylate carboxylase, partial [Coriobacteriales bacterium]|nr:1-(5-phosphoribosyl)-5-amino-4-imidazole-carboxylate carboxylase [Coriobacteriales bacterium]